MSKSILIPVALDHEELVAGKIALARKLLEPGGRITLLTVLENIPSFVDCEVRSGKPGVAIVEYARENGIDLIIVGAHHPTAGDYFLGSTAARVARRAECAVHILR